MHKSDILFGEKCKSSEITDCTSRFCVDEFARCYPPSSQFSPVCWAQSAAAVVLSNNESNCEIDRGNRR